MHFEEKNDFLYFWLIFVEAPSENVVSKHHLYISTKSHRVSRKNLVSFCSYAPKASRRG